MIHEIFFTKVSASIHKIRIEFSKQKITFQILLKPYFFLSIFCIPYSNMAWQKNDNERNKILVLFHRNISKYQPNVLQKVKQPVKKQEMTHFGQVRKSKENPSEARGRNHYILS
jgi:hypothetical protein